MSNTSLELTSEVFQERINNVYNLLEKSALHIFQANYGHERKVIEAVVKLKEQGSLVLTLKILDALKALLETEEGKDILSTYKRLHNILKNEKFEEDTSERIKNVSFKTPYEIDLDITYNARSMNLGLCMFRNDIDGALNHLKELIEPLNNFLDNVIVNDEDIDQKHNKLSLLKKVDKVFQRICKWEKLL